MMIGKIDFIRVEVGDFDFQVFTTWNDACKKKTLYEIQVGRETLRVKWVMSGSFEPQISDVSLQVSLEFEMVTES